MRSRNRNFRRSAAALLSLGLWAPCAAGVHAAAGGGLCPWADRIAARYRAADFPRVESIRFTVRESAGGDGAVRHWTWFPKTDSVSFDGPDPKGLVLQAGYSRKNEWSVGSRTIAGIDRLFVQDRSALLFPVLFARDGHPACEMGEGGWLAVAYPAGDPAGDAEGGKTYGLLADSDGTIRAWKGPGTVTGQAGTRFEWSKPKMVDGLPLSLERTGPHKEKIRFTEVKIEGLER